MAMVIIFATTAVFIGCKKEDNSISKKNIEKIKKSNYEIPQMNYEGITTGSELYNRYLEYLVEIRNITGIDIIDFVQQEEVKGLIRSVNNSLSQITQYFNDGTINAGIASGTIPGNFLEEYYIRAREFVDNGVEDECEQFDFISQFSTIMFPLEILDLEYYCDREVYLPGTFFIEFSEEYERLTSLLGSYYSTFSTDLTENQKEQILAEVFHYYDFETRLEEGGGDPDLCFGHLEDERDRTILLATISLLTVIGHWYASMALGPIAIAIATAELIAACIVFEQTVDGAWELYHLKGGTERKPRYFWQN